MTDCESEVTRLANRLETLAVQEARRADGMEENLLLIRRSLWGNGDQGIAERLRNVERVIESGRKLVWLGAVAVIGLFGSLAWQITTWYIQQGV